MSQALDLSRLPKALRKLKVIVIVLFYNVMVVTFCFTAKKDDTRLNKRYPQHEQTLATSFHGPVTPSVEIAYAKSEAANISDTQPSL